MNYIDNQWTLTLIGTNINNTQVLFQAFEINESAISCSGNKTGTIKFREAFNVTIEIYKVGLFNSTYAPTPYYNDFDYVYIVYQGTNPNSIVQQGRNSIRTVNSIIYTLNRMIPQSKVFKVNRAFIGKDTSGYNEYLWGKYTNGQAKIKVYEKGYYDIYTLNTRINTNSNQFTEFQKPSRDDYVEVDNRLISYNINQTEIIQIEANGIEIEGMRFWEKIFYTILIIMIFLVTHAILFFVGERVGLGGNLSVMLSFLSVPVMFIVMIMIWGLPFGL
jgi:hypothetical protein